MLLQKRPKDNWEREDDRKGVCGLVSRLHILRNAAEETQVHANREANERLHGTLVLFSFHLGLDGREADWENTNCF